MQFHQSSEARLRLTGSTDTSLIGTPVCVGTKEFSVMRPLPPGDRDRDGPPSLRNADLFHPLASLRETLFLGSPLTHGLGGYAGEMNPCVEAGSRILIANSKIGAVIGRGGAIIRHIREVSGASITISPGCWGDHGNTEERMVTMRGTFNAVQLATTHILSHSGTAVPNANPAMGPFSGDCPANAVRMLIPDVKTGGVNSRHGFNINTIRKRSGACATLSKRAYTFNTSHGPLQSPQAAAPNANPPRVPEGVIPAGAATGFEAGGANNAVDTEGTSEKACDGEGGPSSSISKPTPVTKGRILEIEGSFDACLRAHHLVVWKLMRVKPPSTQALHSRLAEQFQVSATTESAGARAGDDARGQRVTSPRRVSTFSDKPLRESERNRSRASAAARTSGNIVQASPSPTPAAFKQSPPFRLEWGFDNPALVPTVLSTPTAVITPESVGEDRCGPPPAQASSSTSPLGESSPGSSIASVEDFSIVASDARAGIGPGASSSPVINATGVDLIDAAAGGGEVVSGLDAGGAASSDGYALEYRGGGAIEVNEEDSELPPCVISVLSVLSLFSSHPKIQL